MNTFSKILVAGATSFVALAGAANAYQGPDAFNFNSTQANHLDIRSTQGLRSAPAGNDGISVRFTKDLNRNALETADANSPRATAVQSKIRQDANLVKAFEALNIAISNVVDSYNTLTGETIYLVR